MCVGSIQVGSIGTFGSWDIETFWLQNLKRFWTIILW